MKRRRLLILLPLLILLILGVQLFRPASEPFAYPFAPVERGDFNLSLHLRGTLEASRFERIVSPILSNRARIIAIVPEGTRVHSGQIVARFDTKPFLDEIEKWEQQSREAEAAYTVAEKELEIERSKQLQEIEQTKAAIEIVRLQLHDAEEGQGRITRTELEQAIAKAVRQEALFSDEVEDFAALLQKGYISKKEYAQSVDRRQNAREELAGARQRLHNYDAYEWPKIKKEQRIKLKESQSRLEALTEQHALALQNRRAQLLKAQSQRSHARTQLQSARTNLRNCDLTAPIDGTLLYLAIPKGGKREKVQIGDSIWFNQPFMQIPNTDRMIVRTRIRETDLGRVRPGSKAYVRLDAMTTQKMDATVRYIDTIARETEERGIKAFDAILSVEGATLPHSGMSAGIEIVYEQVRDALLMPTGAIFQDNDATFVWRDEGTPHPVPVTLGRIGRDRVEVLEGLEAGDRVAVR